MRASLLLVVACYLLALMPGVNGVDELDCTYEQMVRWDPYNSQLTIAVWDCWDDPLFYDYNTVKAFYDGELVGQKVIGQTSGAITEFVVTVPTNNGGKVDRIELWNSHAETELTYEVDGDSGWGSWYWLPANESIADILNEYPQAKNITVEREAWINGSMSMSWNITGVDWNNVSSFEVIDYVPTSYRLMAWDEDSKAWSMPDVRVNVVRDREEKIPGIWE